MIKIEEAKKKLIDFLTKNGSILQEDPPLVIDEMTIVLSWGWVFYYNGTKYLTTQDDFHSYMGNLPILINKYSGELRHIWRAGSSIEELIGEYEKEIGC